MRILFEGEYYSEAGTIIFTHVVTAPRWRQVMEHKRVWTPVVDDKLTITFPNTRRNFATSIRVPTSSILASFSLGASLCFAYNVAPIICVGGCGH